MVEEKQYPLLILTISFPYYFLLYFRLFCCLSRNLAIGEKNICFIQLDTPKMTQQQMSKIEDICNELIRQGVSMTPRWYPPDAPELEGVRTLRLDSYVLSPLTLCMMTSLGSLPWSP